MPGLKPLPWPPRMDQQCGERKTRMLAWLRKDSLAMVKTRSQPQLPIWSPIAIVAGGVLTYCGVGVLLVGIRFVADLQRAFGDPTAFVHGDPESIAPFVLLLIPAVLGSLATRELLRIVVGGHRDGSSPQLIARAIAAFLVSVLILLVAAFFSSGRTRR